MSERDEPSELRDPGLEALFRRTHAGRSDEAFVAATMRRVEAAKRQRRLGRRLAEAGVLIIVVAASPWLIDASVKLSSLLDAGFTIVAGWLATPAGMALAVAIVAAAAAFRPLLNRLARRAAVPDPGRRDSPDPG
jgi:hypothetical protein